MKELINKLRATKPNNKVGDITVKTAHKGCSECIFSLGYTSIAQECAYRKACFAHNRKDKVSVIFTK